LENRPRDVQQTDPRRVLNTEGTVYAGMGKVMASVRANFRYKGSAAIRADASALISNILDRDFGYQNGEAILQRYGKK
jgi:hypothetical protein